MCCLMRLVGTHVSWVHQIYTERSHQLDHCRPGKLNIAYLRSKSSISTAEVTTCTLTSPRDGGVPSAVMIWPLVIYPSWPEDAPPDCLQLAACGTCTCKRLPHAWVKSFHILVHTLSTFWTRSTETHTKTSSSSILVNGTRDSMVSWYTAANFTRNWGG